MLKHATGMFLNARTRQWVSSFCYMDELNSTERQMTICQKRQKQIEEFVKKCLTMETSYANICKSSERQHDKMLCDQGFALERNEHIIRI